MNIHICLYVSILLLKFYNTLRLKFSNMDKEFKFLNETDAAIQIQAHLIESLNMLKAYIKQYEEGLFSTAHELRHKIELAIYFFKKVEETSKNRNEEEFNKHYETVNFEEIKWEPGDDIQCSKCCFLKQDVNGHGFVCEKELGNKSIPYCDKKFRKDGKDVYFFRK